jgi:hypothetical protein
MDGSSATRSPPRVIRVPLPVGNVASRRICDGIAIVVGVASVLIAPEFGRPGLLIVLGGIVAVALLVWIPRSVNASYRRKRAEFIAEHGQGEPDHLTAALAAKWPRPSKVPGPDEIRDALRQFEDEERGPAYVVCIGMIVPPEVGEEFFEPEIVTPTRALGHHLWFIPVALGVLVFWFLQLLGIIPGRAVNIGSFGYILAMGFSAGAVWIWRSAIRPTYIRMAPGVIQVLEYHHRRRKPTIRSYPLERGTIAYLRGSTTTPKRGQLTLTLLRGEQKDTIEFWRMRQRDAIIQHTWQALLSTAPTPPLSDEDLLG